MTPDRDQTNILPDTIWSQHCSIYEARRTTEDFIDRNSTVVRGHSRPTTQVQFQTNSFSSRSSNPRPVNQDQDRYAQNHRLSNASPVAVHTFQSYSNYFDRQSSSQDWQCDHVPSQNFNEQIITDTYIDSRLNCHDTSCDYSDIIPPPADVKPFRPPEPPRDAVSCNINLYTGILNQLTFQQDTIRQNSEYLQN